MPPRISAIMPNQLPAVPPQKLSILHFFRPLPTGDIDHSLAPLPAPPKTIELNPSYLTSVRKQMKCHRPLKYELAVGGNYSSLMRKPLAIVNSCIIWFAFFSPTTSTQVLYRATPLIIMGRDESVFAQYLLGSRTRTGPAGQRPLLPKPEGDGYMLSAFVSQGFGFGRVLKEAELEKII